MTMTRLFILAVVAISLRVTAVPYHQDELAWKKTNAVAAPPPPPPCTAYANPVAAIVVKTNTTTSIMLPGGNGTFVISQTPTNGYLTNLNSTSGFVNYVETSPTATQDNFTYCSSNSPSCMVCAPVQIDIVTNLLGQCFSVPLVGGVFNGTVVINASYPYEYICIAYTNESCIKVTNCNEADSNGVVSIPVQIGCGSSNFCVVDVETNGTLGGHFTTIDRLTNTIAPIELANNGGANFFIVTRPTNGTIVIANIVTGDATYTGNFLYDETHTLGVSDYFTYTCTSASHDPFTNLVPVYVYNEQWDSIHRDGQCLSVAPTNNGTLTGNLFYIDRWPYQIVTDSYTNGICDDFIASSTGIPIRNGDGTLANADVVEFLGIVMGCNNTNACTIQDCFHVCAPTVVTVSGAGNSLVNGVYTGGYVSGSVFFQATEALTNMSDPLMILYLNTDMAGGGSGVSTFADQNGEYYSTSNLVDCTASTIGGWQVNPSLGDLGPFPVPTVTINSSSTTNFCQ